MRVIFVTRSTGTYGAGRALLDLIDGLLQKGVRCHVIIPRQGLITEGLKSRGVKYSIIPLKNWASTDKILLRRLLRCGWNLFISLVIAIKAYFWKVDVIHTNNCLTPVGAFAAYLARKPHIWHVREFGPEYGFSFTLGEPLSIRLMGKLSFRIVAISEALRQKYSQYIPAQKLKKIYDSVSIVNTEYSLEKSRIPTLVIVGLIRPNKGQMDAVLAVADLVREGIQVKLKIVGDGIPEYFQQLKQAVIQNEIIKQVEFTGFVAGPAPLYKSADIVLVCSRWEAFGRVTVEGMLFKKPVIGVRSGATPELIKEGFNGLLYEPGNHQELAEKIKYLIKYPEEAKQMGENGFREASEKYTIEKCANEVFNIFQEAIKNKNKSS